VISFVPQPLYPKGSTLKYLLDERLGGFQSWSRCSGKEKNPCLYQESEPSQ